MHCVICKKSEDETDLFEGIYDGKIRKICKSCSTVERIPLIKKPTAEQLMDADRKFTVKERMEKLTGSGEFSNSTQLSRDQSVANKNLAKLRFPIKKQQHEDLVEDYYWRIQNARRRKKFPISHVAKETGIPKEIIQSLERGILPKDFRNVIAKLENFFNIRFFKQRQIQAFLKKPSKPTPKEEKEILQQVKQNLEQQNKKYETIEKIKTGKMDFSKRENLQNITLNDLVELKRQREEQEKEQTNQKLKRDMFGDDLEIEEI